LLARPGSGASAASLQEFTLVREAGNGVELVHILCRPLRLAGGHVSSYTSLQCVKFAQLYLRVPVGPYPNLKMFATLSLFAAGSCTRWDDVQRLVQQTCERRIRASDGWCLAIVRDCRRRIFIPADLGFRAATGTRGRDRVRPGSTCVRRICHGDTASLAVSQSFRTRRYDIAVTRNVENVRVPIEHLCSIAIGGVWLAR